MVCAPQVKTAFSKQDTTSLMSKILIIHSDYYQDIAAELMAGALAELDAANANYDKVEVPGVLEIPAAIKMALIAAEKGGKNYDGFVLLGCVIRGETTHYEIVANESARSVMELSHLYGLAVGNGIQTVENSEQAWARARVSDKNKGGGAARAALEMIAVRKTLGA